MDKVIFQFDVLWSGWECDSRAWVMERPDGTRYLKMTDHGQEYEADQAEILSKIEEYQAAIKASEEALRILRA